ncbi:MAG: hypothetical protein LBU61_03900 [Coriobacteriales bacterium]|jgi:ABC-2 type transport system permease protein|nr:hypothetical protein [Coriobacteriales bacterium]
MDETVSYTELLKASLVYLPALWALIGVAVFLVGLLPKAATAIWGYVGFSFFVSLVSRFPGILPEWLVKATPFTHIPKLPVDEMNINAIAVLTVIAIIMTVIGLLLYQRRDLTV